MVTNGEAHPGSTEAKSYAEALQEPVSDNLEGNKIQSGKIETIEEAKAILSDPVAPAELIEEAKKYLDTPNDGTPETNGEVHPAVSMKKTYAEAVSQPAPPPLPEETDDEGNEADITPTATVQPPTPGEYTGTGLDESPRNSMRFTHRRIGSRGSNRANGRPARASSSESSSVVSQNDLNLVYEKYSDGEGGRLISIRQLPEYEQNLKLDEREQMPDVQSKGELELVSGRQAAAGWERSG